MEKKGIKRKIKKKLLRKNPYNPKQKFNNKEIKVLDRSLKKHGILGTLIVFKYNWKEPGTYVVLEGNDRFECFKDNEYIPCEVYDFISSDKELEEITLEFCAVGKKLNRTALYALYLKLDDPILEMKDLFEEIIIDNNKKDIKIKETFVEKTIVICFLNKESYLKYLNIVKNIKKRIGKNSRLWQQLRNRTENIEEYLRKYLFDIILCK